MVFIEKMALFNRFMSINDINNCLLSMLVLNCEKDKK